MKSITTSYLADQINGTLIGDDIPIHGIFNILKDSKKGDVVIRHRFDEVGVKIASKKEVSCIVTQNISENGIDHAKELNLPLIISDKIELANAFALKWALNKFASGTLRIVVTGTNGKSTTTHMIYNILKEAGYSTYTNTDSQSEFNTLIDPMVAKQIAEFPGELDALVVEVSEVQGWMDRIMKDHAHLMTSTINPQMVVLTNVALDHIGLVNSIEEAYEEISGTIKGFKGKFVILNNEDPLIKKMAKLVSSHSKVEFFGKGSPLEFHAGGIYQQGKLIISEDKLPFKSPHFISNTLAAVQAALSLNVKPEIIASSISSYNPLERRFSVLSQNPLIIDDFAHNPDGIRATIRSCAKLSQGKLYLVSAIRGSRGNVINKVNAEAVADGLNEINHLLIITSSQEVVDDANRVLTSEKKVFTDVMDDNGLYYVFFEKLGDALKFTMEKSQKTDTILLIGAQGMDPARELLKKMYNNLFR
ncbi:MAG: Mur ligase family protein [Methanobacterium sp.]|nr:Mur ligase family protein [Methanobacterium sp.]